MKISLVIKNLSSTHRPHSRTLETNGNYCIIGREDADVSISDPKCSRQHVLLYESTDGQLWFRDLGSRNGTYIGKEKTERGEFKVGSQLLVGKTVIELTKYTPSPIQKSKRAERVVSKHVGHSTILKPKEGTNTQGSSEEKTGLTTKGRKPAQAEGLISHWPDNHFAAPKEKQKSFESYRATKRERSYHSRRGR